MGLFKDCGCGCNGKKQEQKLLISAQAALVFFIIASPDTFRLMRKLLGKWVSGPNGCPTTSGLLLHSLVFLLVTWGMMNIKIEGYTAENVAPAPQAVNAAADKEVKKMAAMKKVKEMMAEKPKPKPTKEMGVIGEEDKSFAAEATPPAVMGGMPPMKPKAPPSMAKAALPMPGMAEEPVGMYDSGAMFAPMDINTGADMPGSIKLGASNISVSCADGRRPIVA